MREEDAQGKVGISSWEALHALLRCLELILKMMEYHQDVNRDYIRFVFKHCFDFPGGSVVKNPPAMQDLQGTFLTQGLSRGLLHCRQILYQLSYQGSPYSAIL